MTDREKLDLWHYEKLYDLSPKAAIVRNVPTGRLMLYHVSSAENFPVMEEISRLSHKNLMRVYDTVLDGKKCISLCEYIDGMTLEDAVGRFRHYDEREARAIMLQVCSGLSELHAHGIVHRDVNPSNVMITRDGRVKLIDFDITREEKPDAERDTHILGTLGYTSPEQFGFAQTDGRADVYSCGVLLNYLLTGFLPGEKKYEGKLAEVISTCTEIDREKRYDSVKQLSDVLKGNRFSRYRRFRPLPGFRSRHLFPKILMGLLFFLYFGMFIEFGDSGLGMNDAWWATLAHGFVIFGCWSFFPYMLFGNMFNLSYRLFPKNPYYGRKLTKLLGVLSIILGTVIAYYTM